MTDLVPSPPEKFSVTPTGVSIQGNPSLEEALGFANQMISFVRVAPIVVADIYVYVKDTFGDADAASMVPAIGRTKHTLNNWVSIVRQFPIERRHDGLEMGHYDAVAGIKYNDEAKSPDVGTQDALLKRAARQQMPISRLRELAEQEKQSRIPKVIENGEEADEDKPIFDSSDAGAALAAERDEKRDDFESKSDANQILDNALSSVERACANSNRALLNRDRIDYSRALSKPQKNLSDPTVPATRAELEGRLVEVEASLKGAAPAEIAALLAKLALHYWRPNFTDAQAKQLYMDYIGDLKIYPLDVINRAVGVYRRNEKEKWFPKSGQLIALCEAAIKARRTDRLWLRKRLDLPKEDPRPDAATRKKRADEMRRVGASLKDGDFPAPGKGAE
eukprot:g4955.t1